MPDATDYLGSQFRFFAFHFRFSSAARFDYAALSFSALAFSLLIFIDFTFFQ